MMGVFLLVKVGWRNLWRNPRGTLLTALALGLGLTLLLVSWVCSMAATSK